ncbi:chaperonin 10-like protein [Mycena galericulata]|nr:chaperonin 10-like protein [Mycena galericulata]
MPQQKALVIKEQNAPFTLENWPIPIPGPGQILIKVKATALNPVDWKQQKYGAFIKTWLVVVGVDMAGDVEQIGEAVQGFTKGEKIPPNIDYAEAATIPLGYATAAIGLLAAQPTGAGLNPTYDPKVSFSGHPAFVFGGSSSVGQFGTLHSSSIQILRTLGYTTIITYASGKHTDYLKSLGATHVIDRKAVSTADVPAAVKKITSAPIKIVYDVISEAETRDACFAILATGGIAIAILPGDDKDVDGKKFIFVLGSTHVHREFGILMWKTLPKHVADGVIVPNRVEKLPNGLGGIVDGLKKMENNLISGLKLVAFPQETV